MVRLTTRDNPEAQQAIDAIRTGDVTMLSELLAANPTLATAYVADGVHPNQARTLLHIATDWPGHFPNNAETVAALIAAGADVNAPFVGAHQETPLHWAASTDDVVVMVALLDGGANIEAPGSVLGGGTPLRNARAFGMWQGARLLVARGAHTDIVDEATLGLMDRLETRFAPGAPVVALPDVNAAFWGACHGGSLEAAQFLLVRGAEINYVPHWEPLTPLDAAERGGWAEVAAWLRERGGMSYSAIAV